MPQAKDSRSAIRACDSDTGDTPSGRSARAEAPAARGAQLRKLPLLLAGLARARPTHRCYTHLPRYKVNLLEP